MCFNRTISVMDTYWKRLSTLYNFLFLARKLPLFYSGVELLFFDFLVFCGEKECNARSVIA